jgi:hypothetical protein
MAYNHGSTIGTLIEITNKDCLAVIQSVFPIKTITSLNRSKRDLHIIDPSNSHRTILSGTSLPCHLP